MRSDRGLSHNSRNLAAPGQARGVRAQPFVHDAKAPEGPGYVGEQVLSFGPFQFLRNQRLLLKAEKPVRLGSRAFDVLAALLDQPGEVLSKGQLIAKVWPGTVVEEINLRVHMSALRKALGEDRSAPHFIDNVPGRGYCFVAPVTVRPSLSPVLPLLATPAMQKLPRPIVRMIGRGEIVSQLVSQLSHSRLVTLVGTGGIGKTTVAVAVAEAIVSHYDSVAFIDLATVFDPLQILGVVAAALGVAIRSTDAIADLTDAFEHRTCLIVLDSCEHVVDAVASLVEALLTRSRSLVILATSREPLRAQGEWVRRLPALSFPEPMVDLNAGEALKYSAVELFVERAAASRGGYRLIESDAARVVAICRRLDGVPLAIELAASQVDTTGISELANALEDDFRILARGRRTAMSRHQTLRATLEWSIRLLTPFEELILRRLSVFNGGFNRLAAREVTKDSDIPTADFDDALSSLVAKSLVGSDWADAQAHFRLLDATRAYAREKLDAAGESPRFRRRHAEYYRTTFDRANAEWESRPTREWLDEYAPHVSNLRAALDWAFAQDGDTSIGAALTVAAVPLWFQLSLVDECLESVQRAIAALDSQPIEDLARKMRLYAALGWPQMRSIPGVPAGATAWRSVLVIAEELGDVDYQLRALWALWADSCNRAEHRAGLALAERFYSLAAKHSQVADVSISYRMRARSFHYIGDQAKAGEYVNDMLANYVPPTNRSHLARFQYDQQMIARVIHARVLWMRGFPDQAMRSIEGNLEAAFAAGHVLTITHVLADGACALPLLTGDLPLAGERVKLLHRYTKGHALDVWRTYADAFQGQLLIRTDDPRTGVLALRVAIGKLEASGFVLFRTPFLASLAEGFSALGQTVEAVQVIERALALCEASGEGWFVPELHRITGEIILNSTAPNGRHLAEASFTTAIHLARKDEALSWELRAATSMARLHQTYGQAEEGSNLLRPVLARFSEGEGTADVMMASALLL
jgi:predicted ATPase/DNA-binding winged helix-turn-helix (wHTH) protein